MPEMAPTSAHGFGPLAQPDAAPIPEPPMEDPPGEPTGESADRSDPPGVPPEPVALPEPVSAATQVSAPPPEAANADGPRSNAIAVVAFIFGLLSPLGAVTAIPAIVCGAIGMRRSAKRWMAVIGFVLGGVFLDAWLATGAMFGVRALRADPTAQTSGPAPTSSYDITIDECKLTATGAATISGTITNRTKRSKSFEVVATLSDEAVEPARRVSVTMQDVPARGAAEYQTAPETFPFTVKAITCRIVEVRNAP